MLERRGELAQQLRELGKFRFAGAARRVRLALEAGEPVDHVDGVVGAALLAVIDDVDAGGLLPAITSATASSTAASSAAPPFPLRQQ